LKSLKRDPYSPPGLAAWIFAPLTKPGVFEKRIIYIDGPNIILREARLFDRIDQRPLVL